MSHIRDLLEHLCPNGVEFRAIGEIGEVFRGRRFVKSDYVDKGIGAIHYGQLYTHFDTKADDVVTRVREDLRPNLRFVRPGDVVIAEVGETVEDVGKAVAWLGKEDVAIHDGCYGMRHDMDPVFIAYYFQTPAFHGQKNRYVARAKMKRLSIEGLRQIRIPVPPDEVQAEIVRALDLFRSLQGQLTAELEAEATSRRRQHAHYEDALLEFPEVGVRWSTLGEISRSVSSGATPRATRREYYDEGDIPWLRTQEVRFRDIYETAVKITKAGLAHSSAKWIPANCVIVAISGATAGRSGINKIPLTTNQHCCNLEIDPTQALYRFVFYWVRSRYEQLKALGQGARSDLNSGIIKNFPIPVPSLDEQERIVRLLDGMDQVGADLASAISAERSGRRQQYMYWRERLLTFEEAT